MGGEFVINPTKNPARGKRHERCGRAAAATRWSWRIGGAQFVPEEDIADAVMSPTRPSCRSSMAQDELQRLVGTVKKPPPKCIVDEVLVQRVNVLALEEMRRVMTIAEKFPRRDARKALKKQVRAELAAEYEGREKEIDAILEDIEKHVVRRMMVEQRHRIDGRAFDEIRPITIEVGNLPRTHGSALFTRGETQVLAVVTLGSSSDEQKIDALAGESFKSFMLHYNFPAFSVGEVRPLRGPGRREIGHGALAERSINLLAPNGEFPNTIRVVSEVLESNGSSSMATVCCSSLALMDAGVPVSEAVAGIAMGLVKEGDEFIVLSDILGDEDHLGDMDFKVTGTEAGITAFQMDVKISGVNREILSKALNQARAGRIHILGKMKEVITQPRPVLSPYAPRVITIQINPDKIRERYRSGGKMIRSIVAETGAKIDIDDSGRVVVMSPDAAACDKAINKIRQITAEPEIGQTYMAKIVRVTDFGAFAEILPNTEGLIHISQLEHHRVRKVTDVVNEGDEVLVKVIDIDKDGRIRLSRKAALPPEEREKQ